MSRYPQFLGAVLLVLILSGDRQSKLPHGARFERGSNAGVHGGIH